MSDANSNNIIQSFFNRHKSKINIIASVVVLIIIAFFVYYLKYKFLVKSDNTNQKIKYETREIYINQRIDEYEIIIAKLQSSNDSLNNVISNRNNRIMDLKREKERVLSSDGITDDNKIKTDEDLKRAIIYLKNIR